MIESSRVRRKIRLENIVLAAVILLPLAGIVKIVWDQQFSTAYVWTRSAVEATWIPSPTSALAINRFDQGWDRAVRFYAAVNQSDLIIVDRLNGRSCNLGSGPSASTGAWVYDGFFGAITYDYWVRSQYGLDVDNRLDLETWQVTTTVSGDCFDMGSMSCSVVDPPRVSTQECTS